MPEKILQLFDAIRAKRPVLARLLDKYGSKTLGDFTGGFSSTASFNSRNIQTKDDLIDIASTHIEKLLGRNISASFAKRLKANANLLTANHHCVNISDLPVQGTLAFALSEDPNGVLPVFAFGDIPLNNSRYPRGILFAGDKKLPLFPDKYKNTLVSASPSFTADFVAKAIVKSQKMFNEKIITQNQYEEAKLFLNETYLSQEVLNCSSYSDQAVILSNRIWKMFFSSGSKLGKLELVHIEIEKLVSELLLLDLRNTSSLAYNMLFNDELRRNLIAQLDGKNGCWNQQKLKNLLKVMDSEDSSDSDPSAGSGTIFFWGLDSKGRRIPLNLEGGCLRGISDSGEELKISFSPDSVIEAIKSKVLLPGLFLSFAAVSFARGYKCYGGFMQVDYLTVMRNGLSKALIESKLNEWAEIVKEIETENYCTGMIFVLFKPDENTLFPAGGIEIALSGGLTDSDIEKIRSISLNDSNLFGLPRIYRTVFRLEERTEELSCVTAMDIFNFKKDNFIIIR